MQTPLPSYKFVRTPKRYTIAETCPCGKDNKDNKFVPLEGFTNKGYCHSCGETFFPDLEQEQQPLTLIRKHAKPESVTALPFDLFEKTVNPVNLKAARANSSLYQGLINIETANIPAARIEEAMSRFYIGFTDFQFVFPAVDANYISQKGANVFWLIDEVNRIRGGQVVLFDELSPTCATVKNPDRHTRPVYMAIESSYRKKHQQIPEWLQEYKAQDGNKMPCLFGLPQLKKEPTTKPVAICEAYKTALIGWIYFPEYTWLAIGSKGMLKARRLKPIAGRSITLFPDLSSNGDTFELWSKAAGELQRELGGRWLVSRILEDAPGLTDQERKDADLADYLLTRCDWTEFQKTRNQPLPTTEPPAALAPLSYQQPSKRLLYDHQKKHPFNLMKLLETQFDKYRSPVQTDSQR